MVYGNRVSAAAGPTRCRQHLLAWQDLVCNTVDGFSPCLKLTASSLSVYFASACMLSRKGTPAAKVELNGHNVQ